MEVNRPDRSTRRRIGKDDTIDAEAAARAYIAGTAAVIPKAGDDLGGLRSGEITTPLAAAKMTLHTLARRIQQLDQELKETVRAVGSADDAAVPRAASHLRGGRGHQRHSGRGRRRQPGTDEIRGLIRCPLWCQSAARQLGQGGAAPAEPQRHQQTREYVERRTAQGRSMKEIIRCL